MELNVYTLFNRIDGCADALNLGRSDQRAVKEIVNGVSERNRVNAEKHFPQVDLSEYELRKVAVFDDVSTKLTPIVPYEVIPLTISEN